MFTNGQNMVCYNEPELKRQVHRVKNTLTLWQKKVLRSAFNKEGHAVTSYMKGSIATDYIEKATAFSTANYIGKIHLIYQLNLVLSSFLFIY